MKTRMLIALVASLLAIAGYSQRTTLPPSMLKQLEQAEKEMFDATERGDSLVFEKISGKEYLSINANGAFATREQAIAMTPRFKGFRTELSEQQTRAFDNFALRTGRLKVFMGTEQVAEALYTSGWIYRNKKWEFVHWQGTPSGMLLEGKGLMEPPKK